MLTREERREALDLVRMDDDGDSWGTCMLHWFGVANVLYAYTGGVPSDWEYRPGLMTMDALTEWPDSEYAALYTGRQLTVVQLMYIGDVMMRWSSMLRHAGRDY